MWDARTLFTPARLARGPPGVFSFAGADETRFRPKILFAASWAFLRSRSMNPRTVSNAHLEVGPRYYYTLGNHLLQVGCGLLLLRHDEFVRVELRGVERDN